MADIKSPDAKAITLEIDGKPVQVENGQTVMDAASKLGIFVPHFCYHEKLSIAANCRMCLVQVEKAPKPLPACATPATEGMKVQTHSAQAVDAQKGVMEFLLINHPLDCPICDQGGECQLQDLAVGYGASSSRYQEEKRVVVNKNLGPLIATDMTRCIHCTRCVRFGQELAGVMELGMAGRGEHSEILAFVGRTVDSEVSGNMIDLCPVGALTSKPFRYSARNWELSRRKSVSPHDSLGSNLVVQTKNERVMRVLPLRNDAINEFWLSDRDRFAYEGLNSDERLTRPMVKRAGAWAEVDWAEALEAAAQGLKDVVGRHGAQGLGMLLAPNLTAEELHLAARLAQGLGCGNVDSRIRQRDFRAGPRGAPWLGMPVADIEQLQSVLLVGSTIRKEQPLLAVRLRQGVKRMGLAVNTLHVAGDDLLMPVANAVVVPPSALAAELAAVAAAVRDRPASDGARSIARSLASGERKAILLGHYAQQHPDYAAILSAAGEIAAATGALLGILPDGANAAGARLVGAASPQGLDARGMIAAPRAGYLIAGVEAEYDMGREAAEALGNAEFVVALSSYRNGTTDRAHVLLPIAPFTETAGTFVSMEGRAQSFNAVVKPLGETRPGWKVLRMLGAMLGLADFEAETIEAVRAQMIGSPQPIGEWARAGLDNAPQETVAAGVPASVPVEAIVETGIYAGDPVVRRAGSLQKTADARACATARLHPATLAALGIAAGERVRVRQGGGETSLVAAVDAGLPEGCVRLARGLRETAALGDGPVTVEKERAEVAA
jgi:NADH-quinone oxidoreductase subunit G